MAPTFGETFGRVLKRLRNGKKLNQRELSIKLGMSSQSVISGWEQASKNIGANEIEHLLAFFKLDIYRLCSEMLNEARTIELERMGKPAAIPGTDVVVSEEDVEEVASELSKTEKRRGAKKRGGGRRGSKPPASPDRPSRNS